MDTASGAKKESPIVLSLNALNEQIDRCQHQFSNLTGRLQPVLGTEAPPSEKTEPEPISGNSTIEQRINKMKDAVETITEKLICILDRLQI